MDDKLNRASSIGELQDASGFIEDHERVASFVEENGYLFLRGILPRDRVQGLHLELLKVAGKHGFLSEELTTRTKPGLVVFEKDTPDWLRFYKEVLCLRSLNALPADESLYRVMATVLREPIFHHARVNVRFFANFPVKFASPPHRDFTWIGGTDAVWTSWIPLGDIDLQLGGLHLIPGSHRRKYPTRGEGENDGIHVPETETWYTAEQYQMGDVVFFHSNIVHSGGGNLIPDRLRMSAECRFQPISHPVRDDVMQPHWKHLGLLTWEELYNNWPLDDELKYYWHKLPLTIVTETEGSYHQDLRKRYLHNFLRLKSAQS